MATLLPPLPTVAATPESEDWDDSTPHGNIRTGLTKLYTKLICLALLAFVIPLLLASIANTFEWRTGILLTILIYSMAFVWVLPLVLGAESLIDLVRRFRGRTIPKKAFAISFAIFFGGLMGPVALLGLPLKGFGGSALFVLAFAIPVIIYAIASEKAWVIRGFAFLCVMLFAGTLLYWAVSATVPAQYQQSVKDLAYNNVLGPIGQLFRTAAVTSAPGQITREIEEAVTQSQTAKVTQCLNGLKTRAAKGEVIQPEEISSCEALDKNPWKKKSASTASTPSKDGSPATGTSSAVPLQTSWSGKFIPSQGELDIGTYAAGSYRVTGSGRRTQAIYKLVNGEYVIDGEYGIDKDGIYDNGSTGRGDPTPTLPFPDQPYGAVIAKVNGKWEWAANGTCFPVPTGANVTLGINTKDDRRNRAGQGGFDLRVEKC